MNTVNQRLLGKKSDILNLGLFVVSAAFLSACAKDASNVPVLDCLNSPTAGSNCIGKEDGNFQFNLNSKVLVKDAANLLETAGINDGTRRVSASIYRRTADLQSIQIVNRARVEGRNYYHLQVARDVGNARMGWVHEGLIEANSASQPARALIQLTNVQNLSAEISQALNAQRPEQCVEIVIPAGTHTLSMTGNGTNLVLSKQGTKECPNIIRGAGSQTIITRDASYTESMISIRGARYLMIRDLTFKEPNGSFQNSPGKAAIHFDDVQNASSHVDIVENNFDHTGAGIWVKDNSKDLHFAKNVIFGAGAYGTWFGEGIQVGALNGSLTPERVDILGNFIVGRFGSIAQQALQGEGIEVQKYAHARIADNTVHNVKSTGIIAVGGRQGFKNHVEGNHVVSIAADNGIQVSSDVTVRNNLIAFFSAATSSGPNAIGVFRYQSVNSGRNTQVEQNTALVLGASGGAFIRFTSQEQALSRFNDNAVYALDGGISSTRFVDFSGIRQESSIRDNVTNPHQISIGTSNRLGKSLLEDLEINVAQALTTGKPQAGSTLCQQTNRSFNRLDMNGTYRSQCGIGAVERTQLNVWTGVLRIVDLPDPKNTTALDRSAEYLNL